MFVKFFDRLDLSRADLDVVLIVPANRAKALDVAREVPLLGRFAFDVRYTWFRNWVNGPSGQRLGLAPVPETLVSLRALRRTLAIELAYRPGGVLAAKLHLQHIATATTEGYASRPGGAQAELLAEVNKHEAERNLDVVWTEFRNYQQGIMPAGPGAGELTEFFAHVDAKLAPADAGAPKVQRSDRDVLNLLSKRAQTLHLGTANYCWLSKILDNQHYGDERVMWQSRAVSASACVAGLVRHRSLNPSTSAPREWLGALRAVIGPSS